MNLTLTVYVDLRDRSLFIAWGGGGGGGCKGGSLDFWENKRGISRN